MSTGTNDAADRYDIVCPYCSGSGRLGGAVLTKSRPTTVTLTAHSGDILATILLRRLEPLGFNIGDRVKVTLTKIPPQAGEKITEAL